MKIGTVLQNWAQAALAKLDEGYVCLVAVCEAKGSAPREAGAAMLVYKNHIDGSIGGGELEFQAIKTAPERYTGNSFCARSEILSSRASAWPVLRRSCQANV